jgi:hypothetical protein
MMGESMPIDEVVEPYKKRVFGLLVALVALVGMVSATGISVEGHIFALATPDGWTVGNANKMSVPTYLAGAGSYHYTGTYVGDAFSIGDGTTSISVAIVKVPNEASNESTDDLLRRLDADMMTVMGHPSEKYIDFDGRRAYLVEAEFLYSCDGSASVLSMTVALDKTTYAYVYGDFKNSGKAWDVVKDMTIT